MHFANNSYSHSYYFPEMWKNIREEMQGDSTFVLPNAMALGLPQKYVSKISKNEKKEKDLNGNPKKLPL